MRVSCGLGGHVRQTGTGAAKVSTRWSQAGSQKQPTLRASPPPACAPAALGYTESRAQIEPPQTFWPTAKSYACPEMGNLELPAPHACPWVCPTLLPSPKMSRRLGWIVKEAASTVVKKESLAQPCEPPGRPRTGSGGEGTPHFSPQDGWGRRELAARLRARHTPWGLRAS